MDDVERVQVANPIRYLREREGERERERKRADNECMRNCGSLREREGEREREREREQTMNA